MWMTGFPSMVISSANLTLAVHDDVKPVSDTQSCIDIVHNIDELSQVCAQIKCFWSSPKTPCTLSHP